MEYDINTDIGDEVSDVLLANLIDCAVCGEIVTDSKIIYYWFEEIENEG